MRQQTPFLHLDIDGITDEASLVYNYVSTMMKIDEGIRQASQQGVDELETRVTLLESKVTALEEALAKTGESLTVEGLAGGILTAGGYVAVADTDESQNENSEER